MAMKTLKKGANMQPETVPGKTALITGSTSGIGLAIARGFARAGINIVLNGSRPPEAVESEREKLGKMGVEVIYRQADMGDADDITAMVDAVLGHFGGIDIVVNNAGIQHVENIEDFPRDKWDAIISINLSAAFHTVRAALPAMRQRGWGRIINIASAHSLVASPYKSAYVAAKHGLAGFTKTVALEAARDGITCNAICPGYVLTPLVQNQITDTAEARGISEQEVIEDVILAAQWTKKFVTVEQIAGVALFLCSAAADNITGIALPVDGGWTAA
jgi:3-hydroxybutyrate dehydrogenase